MTPLAPLSGRAPPTSALAAFANKTLSGAALKPLTSSVRPTLDGALVGDGGGTLTGEVSALAAFAKKAALLPPTSAPHSPLDRLPSGSMPKRPAPLAVVSTELPESKIEAKNDAEASVVAAKKENKGVDSEPKAQEARDDSAGKPSGVKGDMKINGLDNKIADGQSHDGSDCDSMAEFACMESDDEDAEAQEREAMDVDDLYDHDGDKRDNNDFLRAKERMFVPPTSKHDLFHSILVKDVDLLTHILSHMTPLDVLGVRDAEERTMYHYAALSRSPEIQAVVFDFVSCFITQETDRQIAAIESKQRRLDRWRNDLRASPKRSDWVPPSVKQVQASTNQELTDTYLAVLRAYDCNGRSFLHYSTLNTHVSPVQVSHVLAKILQSHRQELLHKDVFERDSLAYAVMADNTHALDLWFTHMRLGECLSTSDVDRLTQLQMTHSTQRALYELLEGCDSLQSSRKKHSKASNCGLSVQFLTKCPVQSGASSKALAPPRTRMWTSLHKAVIYGNTDAVQHFIDQGACVNERDSDGWTPLHHCSAQAHHSAVHYEIAAILLDSGADVNATSMHRRTPLHVLAMQPLSDNDDYHHFSIAPETDNCSNRCLEFARLLCGRGANLDVSDEDHYTPFLATVRVGNILLARFFLESSCDSFAVNKTGGCALHISVSHRLEAMTRFLCWWDAQCPAWRFAKDFHGRLPKALVNGDNTIRHCLDNLWYSVRLSDVDKVRQQLWQYRSMSKHERAQCVSIHDKTPLTQRTALHLVIEQFLESSKHDTRKEADPTLVTTSPLSQEAKQIVLHLLEEGANLSIGDRWGISPLMLAACIDAPLIMEAMLKFATEESLMQRDSCGNTAVHYSYAFSRAKISTLLEDAMHDADSENNDGRQPLAVTGFRDRIFPSGYRTFLATQRSKLTSRPTTKSIHI